MPEQHQGMENARRRLDAALRRCLSAGVPPEEITYNGVPIQEFTREEILIMLADKVRQASQMMEGK